jgi:hypothetical protein
MIILAMPSIRKCVPGFQTFVFNLDHFSSRFNLALARVIQLFPTIRFAGQIGKTSIDPG